MLVAGCPRSVILAPDDESVVDLHGTVIAVVEAVTVEPVDLTPLEREAALGVVRPYDITDPAKLLGE